jgi:ectoine hydroxylase-related dioxygenase (phytanoyl-CoA dioxygenase family)
MISDRDIAQFHELGYFVTEPALEAAQLAEARREFDRLWREEIAAADAAGDERRIRIARHRAFIGQAHSRSAVLAELVHAPIYREACAKLVGPDADLYYNQVVIKSPQRGAHFGWHQDSGYTTTVPLAYITCWTAISRATLANGCIWIIPGSHHRGLVRHEQNQRDDSLDAVLDDERGAIPVELRPGQIAIFSSLLLHKSGPNTSDEARYGYVPQYHHAGARIASSGQLFGDQVPVLRGGQPVGAAAAV